VISVGPFYSQYGEDKYLHRIFRSTIKGVAVEVGAFDGRTGSNTLFFEKLGWLCILVEPNPHLAELNRSERKGVVFECAVGADEAAVILTIPMGSETLSSVSSNAVQFDRMLKSGGLMKVEVRQRTLDSVLEESGITNIDFITIDVEGYEMEALKGFNINRWKPRIVILEDNYSGTNDEVLLYLQRLGYVRFRNTGCNDWYCAKDDELARLSAIITTEAIKALKGLKRVSSSHLRRMMRSACA
jgi:FkbM family methyltransferase